MKSSPLQLSSYQFTEVNVSAQQNVKPEEVNQFDVSVKTHAFQRVPENPKEWWVFVRVTLKGKDGITPAYIGQVDAFGSFTVIDEWPEDQIEKVVFVNGGATIYAGIREMICGITSRCIWGMQTIPSFSFMGLYEDWIEE